MVISNNINRDRHLLVTFFYRVLKEKIDSSEMAEKTIADEQHEA